MNKPADVSILQELQDDTPTVVELAVDEQRYRIVLPDSATDYIQKKIAGERQPYEREMLEDMRRRLEPGDLVIDAGANIGNHTLFLASVAQCRVVAFEPNAHLCGALLTSVELNQLAGQVSVRALGLGRQAGCGRFAEHLPQNLGGQRIEHGAGDLQLAALDAMRLEQPVRAIKIDVEGMELDVLHGAAGVLERDRPILYVECQHEAQFRAVANYLGSMRYGYWDTFNATPTHLFIPNERISIEDRIARLQLKTAQAEYQATQQLASVRAKLDDSNTKYRTAIEQIGTLKQRIATEEAARRSSEQAANSLNGELKAARDALLQQQAARAANESQLRELELEAARLERQIVQTRAQAEATTSEAQALRAAAAARDAELHARTGELRALQQQAAEQRQAADVLQQDLARVESDRTAVRQRLEDANAKYRSSTEQVASLQQQLALQTDAQQAAEAAIVKLREAHERAQAELQTLRSTSTQTISTLQRQLELASSEKQTLSSTAHRLGEEVAKLRSEVDALAAAERARQAEFDRIKVEAVRGRMGLADSQMRLEHTRQQLLAAQQQVVRTRLTLSFQLGHALIFGFKSLGGLRALPRRLWDLRRQAQQRRAEASDEAHVEPALRASTAAPNAGTAHKAPEIGRTVAAIATADAAEHVDRLKSLKVAAIMDEFTHGSFRDECNLLQLTPQHWQQELETFQPELLFIESAWRGKDELWGSKVGHSSQELVGIVRWCRERRIPAVFWNKEDPVHFETFLNTAKLFDHVFTTDIDCIHRYKAALEHDRVHLLPFACQPSVHNPVETYERKDAFCFAGAYYVRYPERTRDLGDFVASLPDFRPVEIYDRNFGKNDPNYQFPPEYQPFIVGTLPFDQIDKAYKGYRYAINLNSIKQSQSMFARRVYELLGSNTITVSNYSRGVRLLFGDLVVTSDSGTEVLRRLRLLCADAASQAKLRLAALRKVMLEHTYQDRLAYVTSKVTGVPMTDLLPRFVVLGYVRNEAETASVVASFSRQRYAHKSLVLVVSGQYTPDALPDGVRVIRASDAQDLRIGELGAPRQWLATMVAQDYYGPSYLLDLAAATRYAQAPVVGKAAHYVRAAGGALELAQPAQRYRRVEAVSARSGAARFDALAPTGLCDWVSTLFTAQFTDARALSIDEFNYCRNATAEFPAEQIAAVCDLPQLDAGLTLAELVARAERIEPDRSVHDDVARLQGSELAALLRKPAGSKQVSVAALDSALRIDSALADGQFEYWYAAQDHAPEVLGAAGGRLRFHLEVTPGLNVQCALLFLDRVGQRIGHVVKNANQNHDVELPVGTAKLRLGLRIYAAGSAQLRSLVLGHRAVETVEVLGRAEHLILADHYPSGEDLYRNGFVHRRVVAYRQRGTPVDVFRLRPDVPLSFHEFEDVECITGSQQALERMLASGRYRSVLVHFLNEAMWEVLQRHIDRVQVFVWVHGAEIQPLHRREYNYKTDQERATAKVNSDRRMAFWRKLLDPMPANLKLVFVSRYFAEEVMEDLGFRLPDAGYTVIHNPIDTQLFTYVPKPAEQRKKILSIRPYASAKYANDLSVRAILELAAKPYFRELEFRLIGDGPLFDETLAPLRRFDNVTIERRFLSQTDIAQLHKQYGVFLCPTRMDAQGVSRDEAMSSGLVPVTNAVAAIPEFVDERSGILVPAEDAHAMAQGIARLIEDASTFLAMSASAAARVRTQSSTATLIAKELELFAGPSDKSAR